MNISAATGAILENRMESQRQNALSSRTRSHVFANGVRDLLLSFSKSGHAAE